MARPVVLTTVNHLNKYVFELTIKDAAGHAKLSAPLASISSTATAETLGFLLPSCGRASSYAV